MTDVQPEEVEAILAMVGEDRRRKEVAQRDFRQPRRLDQEGIATVRRLVSRALAGVDKHLTATLRASHPLALVDASETSAEGLLAQARAPLAMARFEVDGQPGWVRWDVPTAVTCIERVLGSSSGSASERRLSRTERRMLCELLGGVVRPVADALGVRCERFASIGEPADIGSWRDGARGGDAHRLRIEIGYERPEGASAFEIWMPGVSRAPGLTGASCEAASALPEHLCAVDVVVSASLGAVEVRLADLLALDPGDVIPLEAPAGAPIELCVDGRAVATAELGARKGRRVVRIASVRPAPEDEEEER